MEQPVIAVENLKKSFDGKAAVNGATLTVQRGEIFGFLGPNGSGKTTTLRMICGLMIPDSGSGQCFGCDVLTQSDLIRLNVGYMTQKFSLYEELTVFENLEFFARLRGLTDRKVLIANSLQEFGLNNRADQLAGSLSGGWKQRLALSVALLHGPKLLLLDEPTAGVDPKARRDFWDHINRLSDQGVTTLVTTHYMDEAERCNRLAYIVHGEMVASGTSEAIIAQSSLTTWRASGEQVLKLREKLQSIDYLQVSLFGNAMHVSGKDEEQLLQAISPYQDDCHWQQIEPSLEDVFIDLVNQEDKR